MRLSEFDELFKELPEDFLYSGYSARVCVLAPDFRSIQQVDDPTEKPYGIDTIWEGLGALEYLVLPHYRSDHPESALIDLVGDYCKREEIPYRTLCDGEVLIL